MLWCPRWTTTSCCSNDMARYILKPLTFVCIAVQAVAVRALRTLQSLICNGGSGVRRAAFDLGMLQGVTSVLLPSIAATAVQRRANSLALAILLVGRTERYLLGQTAAAPDRPPGSIAHRFSSSEMRLQVPMLPILQSRRRFGGNCTRLRRSCGSACTRRWWPLPGFPES